MKCLGRRHTNFELSNCKGSSFLSHVLYASYCNWRWCYEYCNVLIINSVSVSEIYRIYSRNFRLCVFFAPQFFRLFRGFPLPYFSTFSSASWPVRMITHSYCRSWQSVTSFVLQECGISCSRQNVRPMLQWQNVSFLVYEQDTYRNSEPNLKVTSKTTPFKNSSDNFHTPNFLTIKLAKKCENYASKYGTFHYIFEMYIISQILHMN
jgi:hypothetical protein